MVATPTATPSTMPVVAPTVAVPTALLLQVPSQPVVVNVVLAPTHTLVAPKIVPATGVVFTVTIAEVLQPAGDQ